MSYPDRSEKLVAPNLSELAFERLEQAIMQGDIKPGERLSESALARRYGISRGPLREAIGQLEGRRLVERVSHQGARVVSLSAEDLIDLMMIREALEGMACRLAAERMMDDQIARLERLLTDHAEDDAIRTGRGYFQAPGEGDFHQIILDACGNARLKGMLDGGLYSLLRLYRHRISMRPGRPAAALDEHRAILGALKSRDGGKAEAAMRAHIRASRAAVEAWCDEDQGGDA
ncbi:MAG: GntR family transcriptional regulator [Rhodobacteraceae bacterium]|nr:GntR family transcriptional regulator [Paracoccaceae bacterium]